MFQVLGSVLEIYRQTGHAGLCLHAGRYLSRDEKIGAMMGEEENQLPTKSKGPEQVRGQRKSF